MPLNEVARAHVEKASMSIVRFRPAMITVRIGLGRLRLHRRIVAIITAIGVRITRSQVLTICVWVELRAIAGVFDNSLRHSRSCESCRDNSGGANQCEFHLGLLVRWCKDYMGRRLQFGH